MPSRCSTGGPGWVEAGDSAAPRFWLRRFPSRAAFTPALSFSLLFPSPVEIIRMVLTAWPKVRFPFSTFRRGRYAAIASRRKRVKADTVRKSANWAGKLSVAPDHDGRPRRALHGYCQTCTIKSGAAPIARLPMKLEFAFFAHSAILSDEGVFSLLNAGIEWVGVSSFPAKCQNLSLLARLLFEPAEVGQTYDCIVRVSAPDGEHLTPDLCVTMKPEFNRINRALPIPFVGLYGFNNFVFSKPGAYRFSFFIGNLSLGEITLNATEQPKP